MEDTKIAARKAKVTTRGAATWNALHVAQMIAATALLLVAAWALIYEHWLLGAVLTVLGGVLSLLNFKESH